RGTASTSCRNLSCEEVQHGIKVLLGFLTRDAFLSQVIDRRLEAVVGRHQLGLRRRRLSLRLCRAGLLMPVLQQSPALLVSFPHELERRLIPLVAEQTPDAPLFSLAAQSHRR